MTASKTQIVLLMLGSAMSAAGFQHLYDFHRIQQAEQNEAQANGLEDQCKANLGKLTSLANGGFKLEHVPMPACPDGLKRTVDTPERDEVDALTVNCEVSQ